MRGVRTSLDGGHLVYASIYQRCHCRFAVMRARRSVGPSMRCAYIEGILVQCVVRTSLNGVHFACDMRSMSNCKGYQLFISQVVGCDVRSTCRHSMYPSCNMHIFKEVLRYVCTPASCDRHTFAKVLRYVCMSVDVSIVRYAYIW